MHSLSLELLLILYNRGYFAGCWEKKTTYMCLPEKNSVIKGLKKKRTVEIMQGTCKRENEQNKPWELNPSWYIQSIKFLKSKISNWIYTFDSLTRSYRVFVNKCSSSSYSFKHTNGNKKLKLCQSYKAERATALKR